MRQILGGGEEEHGISTFHSFINFKATYDTIKEKLLKTMK
jgi:hypothetical protein